MRSAVQATGRHLTAQGDMQPQHYSLLSFIPKKLMIHSNTIEIAINNTLVHRSQPDMWQTQDTKCPPDSRSTQLVPSHLRPRDCQCHCQS